MSFSIQQFLQGSCDRLDPDQAGQNARGIQENSETSEWKYSSEPVVGQFIVRFLDYKLADAHSAALRGEVDGSGDLWRVIDRKNAAARFPTDFVVVEINLQHIDTIKVRLLMFHPARFSYLHRLASGMLTENRRKENPLSENC